MITFENPNIPQQPRKGVYGWYAKKEGKEITIYIGQAGKKNTVLPKGTLFRGVSELQRNTFTSNAPNYTVLDTDFIVGTALIFFEKRGYKCVWKHINNNPEEENEHVLKEKPILQNERNSNIQDKFKAKKQNHGYWKLSKAPNENIETISEAENEVFKELSEYDI